MFLHKRLDCVLVEASKLVANKVQSMQHDRKTQRHYVASYNLPSKQTSQRALVGFIFGTGTNIKPLSAQVFVNSALFGSLHMF